MSEPYLTADRLEDFRTEAGFEPIYSSEAQRQFAELRSRQNAILQSVNAHAEWCAARGFLDLSTISGRVLSKSEAATLTADCVEDALLTMLDAPTQRAFRETE